MLSGDNQREWLIRAGGRQRGCLCHFTLNGPLMLDPSSVLVGRSQTHTHVKRTRVHTQMYMRHCLASALFSFILCYNPDYTVFTFSLTWKENSKQIHCQADFHWPTFLCSSSLINCDIWLPTYLFETHTYIHIRLDTDTESLKHIPVPFMEWIWG